jgi:hypothetical protein
VETLLPIIMVTMQIFVFATIENSTSLKEPNDAHRVMMIFSLCKLELGKAFQEQYLIYCRCSPRGKELDRVQDTECLFPCAT